MQAPRSFTHEQIRRTAVPLIVILGCFSYPITTVALISLNIPVGPANFLLKGLFSTIYSIGLILGLSKNRFPSSGIPLFTFFVIYGLRLIYDLEIGDSQLQNYSREYYYYYYFLLTFLPATAVLSLSRDIDTQILSKWMTWSILGANVALFASVHILNIATAELTGRIQVSGASEYLAILNPLTFGIMGACLFAISLTRMILARTLTLRGLASDGITLGLGFHNLTLGGSRGPLLALLVLVTLILFSQLWSTGGRIRLPRLVTLSLLLAISVTWYIQSASEFEAQAFFRLGEFLSNFVAGGGAKEDRHHLLDLAIAGFYKSPFVGSWFVTPVGDYPHNIVVEVLMATGLAGGIPFLLSSTLAIIAILRILSSSDLDRVQISAVATIFLVFGQTSGSIASMPEFWTLISLMLALVHRKRPTFLPRNVSDGFSKPPISAIPGTRTN